MRTRTPPLWGVCEVCAVSVCAQSAHLRICAHCAQVFGAYISPHPKSPMTVAHPEQRAMLTLLRVGTYKASAMPPLTSTERSRLFRARAKMRSADYVPALARATIATGIAALDKQ